MWRWPLLSCYYRLLQRSVSAVSSIFTLYLPVIRTVYKCWHCWQNQSQNGTLTSCRKIRHSNWILFKSLFSFSYSLSLLDFLVNFPLCLFPFCSSVWRKIFSRIFSISVSDLPRFFFENFQLLNRKITFSYSTYPFVYIFPIYCFYLLFYTYCFSLFFISFSSFFGIFRILRWYT